jgi:hypothetical protein
MTKVTHITVSADKGYTRTRVKVVKVRSKTGNT